MHASERTTEPSPAVGSQGTTTSSSNIERGQRTGDDPSLMKSFRIKVMIVVFMRMLYVVKKNI